ncbi:hypothetical protein QQM79_09290 [Marinobacteraceae bacterium S3BR75-40.1]
MSQPEAPGLEAWVAPVRDNHDDGASQLARQALSLLADYARQQPDSKPGRQRVRQLAEALGGCRPAMAGIGHLLERWRQRVDAMEHDNLEALIEAAEGLRQEAEAAADRISQHAAEQIPDGAHLLTHSWSSSVAALATRLGKRVQWWVTRSEPDGEGLTLAKRIAAQGGRVTLCTEAQGELLMPRMMAVVVGADRVLGDGSVVNKAGTAMLARSAAAWGVPLLCLCESFKQVSGQDYDPEPHDAGRVTLELAAINLTFDCTPAMLVSARADETRFHRLSGAVVPWPCAI